MNVTVVYHDIRLVVGEAHAVSEELWITFEDLRKKFGWTMSPEGICHGQQCVPVPAGRKSEFVRDGDWFNLAAFCRLLGNAVVHSDDFSTWVFHEAGSEPRGGTQPREAPDFALPDIDGRVHYLADYRGNKVFLFAWASW